MKQVLFVFYKGEGSWSYKLPKDWWFVGAGSAPELREEQFQGPKATKKKAKGRSCRRGQGQACWAPDIRIQIFLRWRVLASFACKA
jgi:hypothetical protein